MLSATQSTETRPSAQFRGAQRRLSNLIERDFGDRRTREARNAWRENGERQARLVKCLRRDFMTAFGLTDDVGRTTERLYRRLRRAGGADYPTFDHVSFYRRGPNLFIVGQPYCLDEEKLRQWCERHKASYTIIHEWAHYYPGYATCFYVEFTPSVATPRYL